MNQNRANVDRKDLEEGETRERGRVGRKIERKAKTTKRGEDTEGKRLYVGKYVSKCITRVLKQ